MELVNPDEHGHLTNRDRDKTEVFNNFFSSVFNIDDGPRGFQSPELEDNGCEIDQLPVGLEIVWDLLLQLDPYKSMEPDGIHPRILKELAEIIAKPLSMIFEQSWEIREVRVDWKLANLVPVFKKTKKQDPGNCRPVNLTSVPRKVMEKII
ncbi:rna-directed dna polymerase from mobile element jockey-like [Pitangus sulphuratus]|nr:rna-directed dna polymerase from mobile element jockey-like [Pitangus sulphuratus]